MLKYIFFFLHVLFIIINFTFVYNYVAILNLIVIISWKLNSNRCILSQIEDYLFKQTLIEFTFGKNIDKQKKLIVPKLHRNILTVIFFINLTYQLINY